MTKTDENAQAQPVVEKPKTAAQIKAEEKAAKAAQAELDAAAAKEKADAEAQAKDEAEKTAALAAQAAIDAEKAKADAEAEAQAKDEAEKTAALAAQVELDAAEAKAKADADADADAGDNGPDGVVVADELTPLQLRIKNNGQRAVCHVTRAVIAANDTTVITYKSANAKNLAKGNFAQMNALKGSKRFEVEG